MSDEDKLKAIMGQIAAHTYAGKSLYLVLEDIKKILSR